MVPVADGLCGIRGKHIPAGQFHWFLYIVSYLQFVTGETVSSIESQPDEVHASKVWNMKE